MRLQNKYKVFNKLSIVQQEFPSKILKFHRTKWKKIQQLTAKKFKNFSLESFKTILFLKKWVFYKSKYTEAVKLKKYFDCVFDKAFSILFLKNLKFLNKKLEKALELCAYLVKPEFRIDVFFWRLKFFSSCYEARHHINNNKILVNNRKIHPNYFLQKGDIITFNFLSYYKNSSFKNILLKSLYNNKFLTFIEIDYYTNTVAVLKNYNDLNDKEMSLFVSNFFDINKIKTFVK